MYRHMTCWYSRVFIQDKNQEIADSLRVGFHSALTRYHEVRIEGDCTYVSVIYSSGSLCVLHEGEPDPA